MIRPEDVRPWQAAGQMLRGPQAWFARMFPGVMMELVVARWVSRLLTGWPITLATLAAVFVSFGRLVFAAGFLLVLWVSVGPSLVRFASASSKVLAPRFGRDLAWFWRAAGLLVFLFAARGLWRAFTTVWGSGEGGLLLVAPVIAAVVDWQIAGRVPMLWLWRRAEAFARRWPFAMAQVESTTQDMQASFGGGSSPMAARVKFLGRPVFNEAKLSRLPREFDSGLGVVGWMCTPQPGRTFAAIEAKFDSLVQNNPYVDRMWLEQSSPGGSFALLFVAFRSPSDPLANLPDIPQPTGGAALPDSTDPLAF